MDSLPASYISVVILAFLSGATTLIGVTLAIALGENPKGMAMGIGFSTGIMVLISLCEVVPESLRIAGLGATSLSAGLGSWTDSCPACPYIAIHNIPEEFAMAVPVVAIKNRALLFKAAILSGLAELAGDILGLMAVHLNPALNPFFMAFAAGTMVIVSFFELVPLARKYGRMGSFALGVAGSVLVYLTLHALIPHERSEIPWLFIPTAR
ncbi:MAG: zinc permease [Nitrospirae bacterium]|nr:zinc permease [Nitrospirota bacterium]